MTPTVNEIYEIKVRTRGNPPMPHMRARCLGVLNKNVYTFEAVSYELAGKWLSAAEARLAITKGHKQRWSIVERFTMTAQSFKEHVITERPDAVLALALKCYNEATLSGTCLKDVIDLLRAMELLDSMET